MLREKRMLLALTGARSRPLTCARTYHSRACSATTAVEVKGRSVPSQGGEQSRAHRLPHSLEHERVQRAAPSSVCVTHNLYAAVSLILPHSLSHYQSPLQTPQRLRRSSAPAAVMTGTLKYALTPEQAALPLSAWQRSFTATTITGSLNAVRANRPRQSVRGGGGGVTDTREHTHLRTASRAPKKHQGQDVDHTSCCDLVPLWLPWAQALLGT